MRILLAFGIEFQSIVFIRTRGVGIPRGIQYFISFHREHRSGFSDQNNLLTMG